MELLSKLFNIGAVNYFFGTPYSAEDSNAVFYKLDWPIAVISFILLLFIGYLLGSFNFATYISKKKYKEDIREHGSGNAGMTNMMRTYGTKAAVLTLLGDILKTVLAAIIGYVVFGKTGAYVAGLGSVIGHTFPIYYNFKGGKGVATAIAMILCTEPLVGIILIAIFVAIVAATKFISLGSIIGALMYPIILKNFDKLDIIELACCLLVVAILVFNHRTNIKRLLNNQENKFSFKKSK